MKNFLCAITASLLCVCLLVFALWRYEAFPDLSGLTDLLRDEEEQDKKEPEQPNDGEQPEVKPGDEARPGPSRPIESGGEYGGYTPTDEIETDLLTVICNAYDNHAESVDLSGFELTADELKTVVSGVRYSCPEYFYVGNSYTYSSNTQSGLIAELCPTYLVDKATAAEQSAAYERTVAEIAAGAPAEGSDFDKVLYLHDYFVQNYCYDYTYTIRDAYNFFEQKTGVCQAYMLAFIATAEELGIRSIPVTSNAMNHAWNLVELEGVWYHLDITWDDTGSYSSLTAYTYFLQSDEGIYNYDIVRSDDPAEIHHDWVASQTATDTRYDDAPWRETVAPMAVVDGRYYCIVSVEDGAGGFLYGGDSPLDMEKILEIDGTWRVRNTGSYYPGCYSGLAVLGDELIYNTDKTLRAYNVTTGRDRLLGIPTLQSGQSIYGVYRVDVAARKLTVLVAETLEEETPGQILFAIPES